MRSIRVWLPFALITAVTFVAAGLAQGPGPKQGPLGPGQLPPLISVDDIVERLMALDKNKDGKITREELPERMQFLIDLGDTNKDGALDRDEIKALVAKQAAAGPGGFGGGPGGFRAGPGPGPGGGFAKGPGGFPKGPGPFTAIGSFGAGPGPGFIAGAMEGVVDDLRLLPKKKDQALAAVKTHQENVRKLLEQARADLLRNMQEFLSDDELKDFAAALDRPRAGTVITEGPPDAPKAGRR
jgi:hypothetical protein